MRYFFIAYVLVCSLLAFNNKTRLLNTPTVSAETVQSENIQVIELFAKQTPETYLQTPSVTSQEARREDFSDKRYIASLVNEYADFYGVDRKTMHLIVANESEYIFDRHVQHDGGRNWNAWGLVQINMKFWGTKITPEQAKNPHFALDFLARKIKSGDGELWTTYRTCINKEVIIYKGKKIKCDYDKVINV